MTPYCPHRREHVLYYIVKEVRSCRDGLTAAYSLTKLIRLTHYVDDDPHAHLPVSRGYPGRVTTVGGQI